MYKCTQSLFAEESEWPSHKSSLCQMTMFVRSDLMHCGDLKTGVKLEEEGAPRVTCPLGSTENSRPLSCLVQLTKPCQRFQHVPFQCRCYVNT